MVIEEFGFVFGLVGGGESIKILSIAMMLLVEKEGRDIFVVKCW